MIMVLLWIWWYHSAHQTIMVTRIEILNHSFQMLFLNQSVSMHNQWYEERTMKPSYSYVGIVLESVRIIFNLWQENGEHRFLFIWYAALLCLFVNQGMLLCSFYLFIYSIEHIFDMLTHSIPCVCTMLHFALPPIAFSGWKSNFKLLEACLPSKIGAKMEHMILMERHSILCICQRYHAIFMKGHEP